MYKNFGDLGVALQDLVRTYQEKTQTSKNITTLGTLPTLVSIRSFLTPGAAAEMKNFIRDYPEFSKLSSTVTKHVTLMSELSRMVDRLALLDVSELQQELAVSQEHSRDLKVRPSALLKALL